MYHYQPEIIFKKFFFEQSKINFSMCKVLSTILIGIEYLPQTMIYNPCNQDISNHEFFKIK